MPTSPLGHETTHWDISHRSNTVEIQDYLVTEGDKVRPGTPLVLIENLDQHSP